MKTFKIVMSCLLVLVLTFLACCTILSWDNLTAKEKKEYTKAELLANYEQGIADEKAKNEIDTIKLRSELENLKIDKSNLIKNVNDLDLEIISLEEERNYLTSQVNNLITINASHNEIIDNLNNQINELNSEKNILNYQISELEDEILKLEDRINDLAIVNIDIYDEFGNLYTTKSFDSYNGIIKGILPTYLDSSIIGSIGSISKWIVEYSEVETFSGLYSKICKVIDAGTYVYIDRDMKMKAVPINCSIFDVTISQLGVNPITTKVCENTYLKNVVSCSTCTLQLQEEINGEWSNIITLDSESFNSYVIKSNIRVIHSCSVVTLPGEITKYPLW